MTAMSWRVRSTRALLFLTAACAAASARRSHVAEHTHAPNLSPTAWAPGDYDKYLALTMASPRVRQPVTSSAGGGVVAGTSNALAVHAGAFALSQGGTAMDACAVTALTQVALAAGSYVSYAGIANIMYYDAGSNATFNWNGGWNTAMEGDPARIPPVGSAAPNGASVMTPGFFAVLDAAVQAAAAFPLSTLLQPAVYFTSVGFPVYSDLAYLINASANNVTLTRTATGVQLFTNPATGSWYVENDTFTQPGVAALLQRIQVDGIAAFYNGSWAADAVALVRANGGNLTSADFAGYSALNTPARVGLYGSHAVATTGAPEIGGVSLLEALALMQAAGFSDGRMQPYIINATAMFWLIQIARWSAFSSDVYICPGGAQALQRAFPDFDFDPASRMNATRAAAVWAFMSAPGGVSTIQFAFDAIFNGNGLPPANDAAVATVAEALMSASLTPRWYHRGPYHSDGIVAMDAAGNVCSMVHTINSPAFGTGLFVDGIALSNAASVQIAPVAAAPRGSRLGGPLEPAIVFDAANRAPTAAIVSVGASLHEVTLQMMDLHLDYAAPVNLTMLVPKFLLGVSNATSGGYPAAQLVPMAGISPTLLAQVQAMGQPLEIVSDALGEMGFPAMLAGQRGGPLQAMSSQYLNGIGDASV